MSRLTQSMIRDANGDVQQKAFAYNTNTPPTKKIGGSYRAVPWVNWQDVLNVFSLAGTHNYYASLPDYAQSPTNKYQIINNTDSYLYISSVDNNKDVILSGPETLIGPFRSMNGTFSGTNLNMVACCCAYNFNPFITRSIQSSMDVRGKTAFIQITPLREEDEPPLPVLRNSWQRIYDIFDLTFNGNTLPTFTTNSSWFSRPMILNDATTVTINCLLNSSAATNGQFFVFLSVLGIDFGAGNFNMGGFNNTLASGLNYVTVTVPITGDQPKLELLFPLGDTSGAQVTVIDMWLSADCHA